MKTLASSFIKRIVAPVALVLGMPLSANADVIDFDLIAEVVNGSLAGTTGTLSFGVDDSLFQEGDNTFDPSEFQDFEFELFGQSFSDAEDIDFPDFPVVFIFQETIQDIIERTVTGIDLVISEITPFTTDIDNPDVLEIAGGTVDNGTVFLDVVYAEPVPAPLPLALIALGLVGISLRKRTLAQG